MPCASKPSCTHGIIISLWLICYIQYGFSISYLSIPGIVTHYRYIVCHIFAFYFQFQYPMSYCVFHLCNCFFEGLKMVQRGRKLGRQVCGIIKTLACLISVITFELLFSLFIMGFSMIIISIDIIIIITIIFVIVINFSYIQWT